MLKDNWGHELVEEDSQARIYLTIHEVERFDKKGYSQCIICNSPLYVDDGGYKIISRKGKEADKR